VSRAEDKTVCLLAALSGVVLFALAATGTASAAPYQTRVTYIACIELTGNPQTFRDLKLRVAERGRSEASALLDYSEKSAFGRSWRWFHTTPREFRNRLSTV
jgi:hypothetical protein